MLQFVRTLKDYNILEYLLTKGGVSFLFRILGLLLSFFIVWLLSNFYNVSMYGNFSIIQTIIQIIILFSTLGIQNVLIFEINKSTEKDDVASHSILIKIIKIVVVFSIIPSIILFFGAEYIAMVIFKKSQLIKHFKLISISILFFILHEIFIYYFIAKKKFLIFGVFNFFLPNLIFAMLIVCFHTVFKNEVHITFFYCLSVAITFLIEVMVIFYSFKKTISVISYKKILYTGLPMMLSGLMIYLLNWTDILMLGAMKSAEDVGIYNASFKLGFLVLIVIASINVIIGPKLSELYQKNDMAAFRKVVHRSTQLSIILTVPIVIFLLLFGDILLNYLGTNFKDGKPVLIIITISSFFSVICGNVDQILNMSQHQNFFMKINWVCLLINFLLNLFLIPQYGIKGSAAASLITTIVINTACLWFIKKKFGFYTFI